MGDGQKGVLVRMVLPLCDAAAHLRPDDIIMRFDGVQVANDGTVPFRRDRFPCMCGAHRRWPAVDSRCRH